MRRFVWVTALLLGCSSTGTPSPANVAGSAGSGGMPVVAAPAGGASSGGVGVAGAAAGVTEPGGAGGMAAPVTTAGAAGVPGSAGASGMGGAPNGSAGAPGGGAGGMGGSGGAMPSVPQASGVLCVFDYDLTLSSNKCQGEQYACRTNTCLTYNWYEQCMSRGAQRAIELCVQRGAYIGIASHANVDGCWDDKVSVVISQQQFPALTSAVRYGDASHDFAYPKLDLRSNWNCDDCAYHMNGAFSKPQLVSKVMLHYGLDPKKLADRAKVIFWDDLPDNISKMKKEMPEVHTIHVHQNIDGQPNDGGCGIVQADIDAGWSSFPNLQ